MTDQAAMQVSPGIGRRIADSLESLPFLGLMVFVFATTFPPFEVLTEVSLPIHMLQHILIVIAGIMIAYPYYRSGKFNRIKSPRSGLLGFALLSSIIVVWHLPSFWDAAILSFLTHIAEHVSFLVVGILIGICIPMLSDNMKVIAIVLGISGHMFYGFVLYISTTPIYPLYSVSEQSELGLLLFAPSPIYLISFLYFNLTRESRRLDRESFSELVKETRRGNREKFVALLGVLLIVTIGVYYVSTFATINASSYANSPNISTIYIEEGPTYWQYSPQNITVVLGVNNTVRWISHSFTQDTVTSADGIFSSGPISPGQTFSYTFTKAGTFRYYCAYHLWMSGTITVLS